jgi:hypothetical protein
MLTFRRHRNRIRFVKHSPLEQQVLTALTGDELWDPDELVSSVASSTRADVDEVREAIWGLLDRREISVTPDRRLKPAAVHEPAGV